MSVLYYFYLKLSLIPPQQLWVRTWCRLAQLWFLDLTFTNNSDCDSMAHLSLTLCILAALCVSITHSWLNEVGWGHKCRNLASKDGNKGVFNVSPDCQIGTVEWHYPQYDSEGLEVCFLRSFMRFDYLWMYNIEKYYLILRFDSLNYEM